MKELYCQEVGLEYQDYLSKTNKSRKNSTAEDITEGKLSSLNQLLEFIGLDRNVGEEGIFRKNDGQILT